MISKLVKLAAAMNSKGLEFEHDCLNKIIKVIASSEEKKELSQRAIKLSKTSPAEYAREHNYIYRESYEEKWTEDPEWYSNMGYENALQFSLVMLQRKILKLQKQKTGSMKHDYGFRALSLEELEEIAVSLTNELRERDAEKETQRAGNPPGEYQDDYDDDWQDRYYDDYDDDYINQEALGEEDQEERMLEEEEAIWEAFPTQQGPRRVKRNRQPPPINVRNINI